MKTGNTLRTAKNSLLCFFTTLAAGFLVACGGDGSGGVSFIGGDNVPTPPPPAVAPADPSFTVSFEPPLVTDDSDSFSSYLFDTAAEGVEYSGPTGNGVTGKGGVFLASAEEGGVFEFSIADTALGSVQILSQDEDNAVTPADFMGVDEAQVITIARIMQALDEDNTLQNGISISQATRDDPEGVSLLYSMVGTSDDAIAGNLVGGNNQRYRIPSVANAKSHLADTRKCLFSGGYVGGYSGTNPSDTNADPLAGTVYYAVEPFANRVKRFGLDATAVQKLFTIAISDVGVTGSEISLSSGNILYFTTPSSVAGTWETLNDAGDMTVGMGTHTLFPALDTSNPGATRRIVGVETIDDTAATVSRLYVLDHFSGDGSFRGQSYSVDEANQAVSIDELSLTIANGVSWPTVTVATMLTLIGDNATIAVEVVRANDNYGSFDGVFEDGDNKLSGTWCDIGGAVGSTVAPIPPTPSIKITVTWSEVSLATSYKLYRSTVSVGGYDQITQVASDTTLYVDTPSAGANYFYHVQACNGTVCSEGSPQEDPAPPVPEPSASAQSATEIEVTWGEVSGATSYKLYRSTSSDGTYAQVGDDISAPTLAYTDSELSAATEYFYQLEACNSDGCSERSPAVSATTQAAG